MASMTSRRARPPDPGDTGSDTVTGESPAPMPRKLSRDARRTQLIEATIEAIAQHGYSRTTMSQVARSAGLSHGLVNFHFETKEKLFVAVLLHLADEYRTNWTTALAQAGPSAPEKIDALIRADFAPQICTPTRLSAWCAFWGETQGRPFYQEHCGANDDAYNSVLEGLCARMNSEHGYACNEVRAAQVLRILSDGIWLDLMTTHTPYPVDEAVMTMMTCAAAFYPRHFDENGLKAA